MDERGMEGSIWHFPRYATISSSVIRSRSIAGRTSASRSPVKSFSFIVARSLPDPFTYSTSISLPV